MRRQYELFERTVFVIAAEQCVEREQAGEQRGDEDDADGDVAQADRLFRSSGRMREKWDRRHSSDGRTYGQMTLDRAMEGRTEFYRGGGGSENGCGQPAPEVGDEFDGISPGVAAQIEKRPELPTIHVNGRHLREISADALAALKAKKSEGNQAWGTLKEIWDAIVDMPSAMRQMAVMKLFQWYGMVCYWQYVTYSIARSLFNTSDPTTTGFRDAVLVNGQIGGFYNAVAFVAAFALVPFTKRFGAKVMHAACLAAGGIDELIVHGRTKLDGYRPPARWAWIDTVRAAVDIPIIANGEVWTVADFRQCQQESGCADIMLGRGALADPLLPRKVRGEETGGWPELVPAVATYWYGVRERVMPVHAGGRLKQWLMLLRRHYPQAEALYQQLRPVKAAEDIDRLLLAAGILETLPDRLLLAA